MHWGGGRGEVSSERDDRRSLLGVKFLISGFFWVGKFWQIFFLGSSDNVRQIKGFWGLDFGPGIFGEFCLKPEEFFGVVIFAPI